MKAGIIGEIGETFITSHLNEVLQDNPKAQKEIQKAFNRYIMGDWGNLDKEDKELNDNAVKYPNSDRILAAYKLSIGKIYIITEQDRSYTTLLFASDY